MALLDIPASAGDIEAYENLEKALFDGYIEKTPKLHGAKVNVYLNKYGTSGM